MSTVREIEQALFSAAPYYMKEDWDNIGHLCGRSDAKVSRVLVALDPFREVVREAVDCGAQLVVSHHPVIFGAAKSVTDATETGRTLLEAIEHGIAIVCMHTNLDSAPGGVNDRLAETLGLTELNVLDPAGKDEQGIDYGIGRVGSVQEQTLEEFLPKVKAALGCDGIRYADAGKPVCKVAVGGGACSDMFPLALALGCDTFVTSDVKYNGFIDAKDAGINLIDAGHYQTEQVVVDHLVALLREKFPDLEIIKSALKTDAAQWF